MHLAMLVLERTSYEVYFLRNRNIPQLARSANITVTKSQYHFLRKQKISLAEGKYHCAYGAISLLQSKNIKK